MSRHGFDVIGLREWEESMMDLSHSPASMTADLKAEIDRCETLLPEQVAGELRRLKIDPRCTSDAVRKLIAEPFGPEEPTRDRAAGRRR